MHPGEALREAVKAIPDNELGRTARRAGLRRETLWRWKTGDQLPNPQLGSVMRLAEALRRPAVELLGGVELDKPAQEWGTLAALVAELRTLVGALHQRFKADAGLEHLRELADFKAEELLLAMRALPFPRRDGQQDEM